MHLVRTKKAAESLGTIPAPAALASGPRPSNTGGCQRGVLASTSAENADHLKQRKGGWSMMLNDDQLFDEYGIEI